MRRLEYEDFRNLFLEVLEVAAKNADSQLAKTVSRNFEIELYGAGYSGEVMDVDTAAQYI